MVDGVSSKSATRVPAAGRSWRFYPIYSTIPKFTLSLNSTSGPPGPLVAFSLHLLKCGRSLNFKNVGHRDIRFSQRESCFGVFFHQPSCLRISFWAPRATLGRPWRNPYSTAGRWAVSTGPRVAHLAALPHRLCDDDTGPVESSGEQRQTRRHRRTVITTVGHVKRPHKTVVLQLSAHAEVTG